MRFEYNVFLILKNSVMFMELEKLTKETYSWPALRTNTASPMGNSESKSEV